MIMHVFCGFTFQSKIKMKISYNPPPNAAPAPVAAPAAAPGTEVVMDEMDGGEGEEEEEEDEVDQGPPQIDPATGQPIPQPKKKKKKRMSKRRFRGKLSNKPQDFQVRCLPRIDQVS